MKDELLETDFENGAILATFEFSTIISVTVLSPRKVRWRVWSVVAAVTMP